MFVVVQLGLNDVEIVQWDEVFATHEDAEQAIKDHVCDCINAVEGGYMEDSPDPTDFVIKPKP